MRLWLTFIGASNVMGYSISVKPLSERYCKVVFAVAIAVAEPEPVVVGNGFYKCKAKAC